MKVLLVSFADGSSDWVDALNRLKKQAEDSRLFSKTVCLTIEEYIALRPSFSQDLQQIRKLDDGPIAYRAVKAWLVRDALRGDFGNFDLVLYLDAGCELNLSRFSTRRLRSKFRRAYRHGGLAEMLAERESDRTKPELLRYLGLSEKERRSRQVQATWSLWRMSQSNLEIAQKWVELSAPSLGLWQDPSLEGGAELHRRDQSIMSILWKRAGLYTQEVECHFDMNTFFGRLRRSVIPILTIRNRGGSSEANRGTGPSDSPGSIMGFIAHKTGLAITSVINTFRFR